jgi:hypothetical protein
VIRHRAAATLLLFAATAALPIAAEEADGLYPWLPASHGRESLAERFAPPEGYSRAAAADGSFSSWLRGLPLLPGRPDILLYDGRRKGNQSAQLAVVDIDVGTRDLQQCADAVIRLRAEFLYAAGRQDEISFDFTSGDEARWTRYRDGWRASISGNSVSWHQTAHPAPGRDTFRDYLDLVFTYAGTYSLSQELVAIADPAGVQPGDVFIRGGFPGHAVLAADVAENVETGQRVFMLLQSYMPAQQIHVLRNPAAPDSPWYPAHFGETLVTPEWTFVTGDLQRFTTP